MLLRAVIRANSCHVRLAQLSTWQQRLTPVCTVMTNNYNGKTTASVFMMRKMSSLTVKETSFKSLESKYTVQYADVGPKDGMLCVCLHGAPGSHDDFQELYAPLTEAGLRVIGMNWPGYDKSSRDVPGLYNHCTEYRAVHLLDFLHSLSIKKIDMLIGHSLGCVTVHQMAAFNAEHVVRSMVSLNPVCHRPHKTLQPFWIIRWFTVLLELPYTFRFLKPFMRKAWKMAGFEGESDETYQAATRDTGSLEWLNVQHYVKYIDSLDEIPRLIAFSSTDKLIQPDISEELVQKLGVKPEHFYKSDEQGKTDKDVTKETDRFARAVQFSTGGHRVQRNPGLIQHILDLAGHVKERKTKNLPI